MAKKIKRYDGEEGSYVSDDDLDQRVYSSRGTGAGLSDDDEEGGGLHEVEYKPEPRSASVSKKTSSPAFKKTSSSVSKSDSVGPSRGNEDIDEEDTSAYHGLPSRKYLKNMPSSEKKQANADRIQKGAEIGVSMLPVGRAIKGIGMVGKAASEVPGYARAVGESGAKAVKQGVEKLMANRASREDMKNAIGRMAEARKNRKAEETHLKKLYSNPGGGSPFQKGGAVVRGHGIESRGKTKGRFV